MKKSQLKQLIKEELIKILKENEYLDQLLDKISSSGMDSLSPKEKTYLDQYSKGENPKSLSPKTFKVRVEKDPFGFGYNARLYAQDNPWIPHQVFSLWHSNYLPDPEDDPNVINVYLNTEPDELDPKDGIELVTRKSTDPTAYHNQEPEGMTMSNGKGNKIINILKDAGNLDDLKLLGDNDSIGIPGKYIKISKSY
jgi:hypothetical protein